MGGRVRIVPTGPLPPPYLSILFSLDHSGTDTHTTLRFFDQHYNTYTQLNTNPF